RLQVGIAAKQSVILSGRIGRSAGTHRHAGCNTSKFVCLNLVPGAWIDASVETGEDRSEQLLDVRRTHRAVIRTTETDIGDGRELGRQLVSIRIVLAAVAQRVPGFTISGAERQ